MTDYQKVIDEVLDPLRQKAITALADYVEASAKVVAQKSAEVLVVDREAGVECLIVGTQLLHNDVVGELALEAFQAAKARVPHFTDEQVASVLARAKGSTN